jgi:tetratricopeptide (TPR) repeat protein
LVIADGHVSLQSQACSQAADTAMLLADYPAAIGFIDKQIQIVGGQEYTRKFSDSAALIPALKRQKSYCEAKIAEEKEDWKEVHAKTAAYLEWAASNLPGPKPVPVTALTRQIINSNSSAMAAIVDDDWLILAYEANKMLPQAGDEYYGPRLQQMLWHLWNVIYMSWQPHPLEVKCNRAAWLLAHTDGHYETALAMVERALRVRTDDPSFLDTLAYVYFSAGKIDEAVQTQEKAVRFAPEVVVFRKALDQYRKEKEKEKEKTAGNK